MQSEFATVGTYRTAMEAHAAKHFLEANGIRTFVLDEHSSTEGLWNDTEVKLRVSADDEQRARELLAAARNNSATT